MDKLASIKIFLQVVRAGSFVRASEQAGLSQTSASRMVRELEEAVGVRLLNRSTRSLSLTDAGERLFPFYGLVVDELAGIEAEAAGSVPQSAPSRLRVALPHTFATRRLDAAICRFREEHANVDLEIRLDDSPTDLIRDGFDLSIRIAPALRSSTISRRIASVPIVTCAAPAYLERRGTPQTPLELADHECLIYTDNDPPDEWTFNRDGERIVQRVRGSVKANNGDLLRALAVAGQGIIFQPAFIVGAEIAAGRLVPVLEEFEALPRTAFAIYPSSRFIPARVRALTDIIAVELADDGRERSSSEPAADHVGQPITNFEIPSLTTSEEYRMTNEKPSRLAAAALAATLAATPAQLLAAPLHTTVFNPGKDAIFPVTSTIVYGPHEAMLVDAQFQRKYALKLVEMLKATGRTLKYIYISHSDPDYYFGLAEIRKEFPAARVISTAQTAYLISATKDAKLQVWKEKLGADAPGELTVPDAAASNEIVLDGEKIEIRGNRDDPAHSFLWIPSTRTILGGISVLTGEHLWMADTTSLAGIDAWLKVIEDMKGLDPAQVIAGHYEAADQSPAQLDFVRDYLTAYRQAAASSKDSAGVVSAMTARFPELPDRETLEFGAKAFTGEAEWHVASPYPPIGRVATVDFGGAAFRLTFTDNKTMSFEDTSGAFQGVKDTVKYTAVEVSRNVFMVYWHEPSTGSNVVHVQDWNTGTVWTNIAGKDGSFTNLKGTIKLQ